MRALIFLAFVLLSVWLSASAGRAQETAPVPASWVGGAQVQARLLVSPVKTSGKSQDMQAALHVKLSPGWHTYWRMPGDAGLPPRLDWGGSENLENAELLWPVPQLLQEAEDLSVFAYKDEVIFPLRLSLRDSARPATLKLKLDLMVCKDICIPETLMLSANTGTPSTEATALLQQAQKTIPSGQSRTLQIQTAVLARGALVIALAGEKPLPQDLQIFAYADDLAFTRKPVVTIDARDPTRALARLEAGSDRADLSALLAGKTLHVTASGSGGAAEKEFHF